MRLWPFQNWQWLDGWLIIHHSRLLARFGNCKCMPCLLDRIERDA